MTVDVPPVFNIIHAGSVNEMQDAVTNQVLDYDIFISAAAVSDFIPKIEAETIKISSAESITLKLEKAPKIIGEVKKINPEIFLVGFKADYNVSDEYLIDSARKKWKNPAQTSW